MNRNRLPPGIDADDLRQEGELAALRAAAKGQDPEEAREKAVRRAFKAAYARQYKESAATDFYDDSPSSASSNPSAPNPRLGWLPEARKIVGLSPPRKQTEGQRKRFLRNQLILMGTLAGFSQRQLARVFDVPHSRIAAIIEEMREKTGHTPRRPPA
jgi:hypothetical protein